MLLHLILGVRRSAGRSVRRGPDPAVLGIRRGDHGKRLTGKPGSCTEVLARRMLTGSRGCDVPRRRGGRPMSRTTDLSAVIVSPPVTATTLNCRKCRARFRWARRKAWRSRKSPNRSAPRPEEVMPDDCLDSAHRARRASSPTSPTGTWDCGPGTRSSARCSASCSPRPAPHRRSGASSPESFSGSRPAERGDAR